MHAFGATVDKVVAPTTREAGTRKGMELNVLHREAVAKQAEERKNTESSPIKK